MHQQDATNAHKIVSNKSRLFLATPNPQLAVPTAWTRGSRSSGLLRRLAGSPIPDVSNERTAIIFMVMSQLAGS